MAHMLCEKFITDSSAAQATFATMPLSIVTRLWAQANKLPSSTVCRSTEAQPIVQAVRAALPELDTMRDNPTAAPVGGLRNLLTLICKPLLHHALAFLQYLRTHCTCKHGMYINHVIRLRHVHQPQVPRPGWPSARRVACTCPLRTASTLVFEPRDTTHGPTHKQYLWREQTGTRRASQTRFNSNTRQLKSENMIRYATCELTEG